MIYKLFLDDEQEVFTYSTKKELLKLFENGWYSFHSKLCLFDDDILILNRCLDRETNKVHWIYIWFDCDVSDCSVGRFQTDDPDDEVIRLFETHCHEASMQFTNTPAEKIELDWLDGWLSF